MKPMSVIDPAPACLLVASGLLSGNRLATELGTEWCKAGIFMIILGILDETLPCHSKLRTELIPTANKKRIQPGDYQTKPSGC